MLHTNDIQRRLTAIEAAIGQASQACSAERDVPGELRTYIQRLDKQSDTAQAVLASRDEPRIRKLIDELEMLGGRARQVCRSGAAVSPQMKSAVNRMHDELAELKQQLH